MGKLCTHSLRACEYICRLQEFMERFPRNSPKALIKTDVKLAYEFLLNGSGKEGMNFLSFLITMWALPDFQQKFMILSAFCYFTHIFTYHMCMFPFLEFLCLCRRKALLDLSSKFVQFKFQRHLLGHFLGFSLVNFFANSPINYFNYSQAC